MRKTYTAKFKREAVRLSQPSGASVVKIAEELSVSNYIPYKWHKQTEQLGDLAFPSVTVIALHKPVTEHASVKPYENTPYLMHNGYLDLLTKMCKEK